MNRDVDTVHEKLTTNLHYQKLGRLKEEFKNTKEQALSIQMHTKAK